MYIYIYIHLGSTGGAVVNILNCNYVVNKFKFQSHNYVQLWTNTPRKGMNPFIHRLLVR